MNPKVIAFIMRMTSDKELRNKIICIMLAITLLVFFPIIALFSLSNSEIGQSKFGKANVPDCITKWRPLLSVYTDKYKCSEYTEFLLALIYVEIGTSNTNDIMQSSESLGLSPNSIEDPEKSIDAGVKYFKSLLDYGNSKQVDFDTIAQSYNFGKGYIDFIASSGGINSLELAEQYSAIEASKTGMRSYGDINYVSKIMKYLISCGDNSILGSDIYTKLMSEALKYQGEKYVYGGDSPLTGFDCSGLVEYVYEQVGIKLDRTAQEQYDECSKIQLTAAEPGDLVFFQGTYTCGDYITHVGIYVGNNRFYQAGNSGVGYADLTGYYTEHLVGFGRVPK